VRPVATVRKLDSQLPDSRNAVRSVPPAARAHPGITLGRRAREAARPVDRKPSSARSRAFTSVRGNSLSCRGRSETVRSLEGGPSPTSPSKLAWAQIEGLSCATAEQDQPGSQPLTHAPLALLASMLPRACANWAKRDG